MRTIYDFQPLLPNQTPASLDLYRGKVALIVNTASHCGFTPQYSGLEKIYQRFKHQGFVVLGFPCNQFGRQEPGTAGEISAFCERSYGVSFPLFAKIKVNGQQTDPLYHYLKAAAPGLLGSRAIKWNFTKFLVCKDGSVYQRYAPITKPEAMVADIEKLLAQ